MDINPYINPQPFISLTPIAPLCDTEKELVLPFAVKQGDIAEATLTLTGSTVANAALDINAPHDTLTYTLPDKLTSGKHTAIVEARNALGCFTTAELSIDVAQDSTTIYRARLTIRRRLQPTRLPCSPDVYKHAEQSPCSRRRKRLCTCC